MRVPHRGKDVAYPILVDPLVYEYWSRPVPGQAGGFVGCGTGSNSSGGGAWGYFAYPNDHAGAISGVCDMTVFGWGHGLYVVLQSGAWYRHWSGGQWTWNTPANSYVSHVTWDNTRHQPGNDIAGNTYAYAGVWNINCGCWQAFYEWGNAAHWTFEQPAGHTTSRSQPYFGLRTQGDGVRGSGGFFGAPGGHSGLEGAVVYLNDAYDPRASLQYHSDFVTSNATRWFASNPVNLTWRLQLDDAGLGIWKYTVIRPDTGTYLTGEPSYACGGGGGARSCPKSLLTPTHYYWQDALNALPEGAAPVQGKVWDINERVGYTPWWYIRIDRSAPTVDLTGALVTGEQTPIVAGQASLHINARDGSTASPAQQRSGIKRVEVWVNNKLAYTTGDLACASGSCAKEFDWTLRRADFDWVSGAYVVTVVAVDQLGNSTSRTIRPYFEVDDLAGAVDVAGEPEADLGDGATEVCVAPCITDASVIPVVQAALDESPLIDDSVDASGEPVGSASATDPTRWGISDEAFDDVDHAYLKGVRRFRKSSPGTSRSTSPGRAGTAPAGSSSRINGPAGTTG